MVGVIAAKRYECPKCYELWELREAALDCCAPTSYSRVDGWECGNCGDFYTDEDADLAEDCCNECLCEGNCACQS